MNARTRPPTRRGLLWAGAAGTAGTLLLGACQSGRQGGDAGAGAAPKTVSGQITWFMRAQAAELPWEQGAVAAFKTQAPDVAVNLETVPAASEFDSKLTALLAAGTAPDVWTHWGQSGFGDYFARGLLADLTAFASRDRVDGSTFLPNTFDVWKRNGKLYGLSFNQRFGTFIYFNKQLFEGAGIPLPPVDWENRSWTWDSMVEAARRLTGAGSGGGETFGFGAGAQPGLWGLAYLFGGDFFTKEHYANGVARTSNIASPEVLAAMTARAELMHRHRVYPRPDDLRAAGTSSLTAHFIAGRLGMLFDTGSEWPRIEQEASFDWGVAAAPRQKDNKVVNFLNPLLLSRDSKNPEAAWAFMKWHITEAGQRVLVQHALQPVHRAMLDEYLSGRQLKQPPADVKRAIEGAAPHGQISPNQLMVDFGAIRTAVDEAMAPTWNGERPAAESLREAKTKVDAILEESFARYGGK
ncbi:MAG TPA: sugar ABC transporter substrate-binding protein [Chloroflexota bacterium]|jgi:multiple sugar transport system substrate-binding protein|nr:sugar ABC transporter substrate-binding protein [Chloroflexota bacterium]